MRSNHIQRPDDAVISKAANAAYRENYDLIFGNRESRTYTGHGHVHPRADGVRMRCGGPSMCTVCALELAQSK